MPTKNLVAKSEAQIYASVLLDAVSTAEEAYDALLDLEHVSAILNTSPDLREALTGTLLSAESRGELIQDLFGDSDFNPVAYEILSFMAKKQDISLLRIVNQMVRDQAQKKFKIVFATVVSAVELDDHLRELISSKIKDEFHADVVLDERVDPDIIGGFILTVNDKRLDASIKTQLEHANNILSDVSNGGEK